ncbi:MAG: cell division protein FtsQ/DivIB [Deinococcales bacterium]
MKQTIWRTFAVLGIVVFALFASSWVFFPVKQVLISGSKQLNPKEVARLAGVSRGNPWLWVGAARAAKLSTEPWVQSAKIVKTFPDTVTIQLTERVPLATWRHAEKTQVIAEDGTVLPGANAKLKLEGQIKERETAAGKKYFSEMLSAVRAARDMGAERVKFDSNGYVISFKQSEIWAANLESLLKYGESVRMMVMQQKAKRINVYSWGVSLQ